MTHLHVAVCIGDRQSMKKYVRLPTRRFHHVCTGLQSSSGSTPAGSAASAPSTAPALHTGHSPRRRCRNSPDRQVNDSPQSGQREALTRRWTPLTWLRRARLLVNTAVHAVHWKTARPDIKRAAASLSTCGTCITHTHPHCQFSLCLAAFAAA